MDNEKEAAQKIRNFIEENFLFGQTCTLQDNDSFLDGGILDSPAFYSSSRSWEKRTTSRLKMRK